MKPLKNAKITAKNGMKSMDVDLEILDAASDPYAKITQLAEDTGLDPVVIRRMVDRMRAQHQPVISELKAVKTQELTEIIEDRMWRALQYMDDYSMSRATVKDLAIAFGILGDKRQLLKGEPTHIISHNERLNLNALAPLLIKEMQRRGIESFAEADYVEIGPAGPHKKAGGGAIVEKTKIKKSLEKREIREP